MQTRPILHTDVGNILPRPAGRQVWIKYIL
jgi:hypothetical protein